MGMPLETLEFNNFHSRTGIWKYLQKSFDLNVLTDKGLFSIVLSLSWNVQRIYLNWNGEMQFNLLLPICAVGIGLSRVYAHGHVFDQ